MEITDYGDELASILMSIHEPDPEDDSIRDCHRITAGMMILERVLGPVADLETPLDHWHDHPRTQLGLQAPAEIDSSVPIQEMIEADRGALQFLEDYHQEARLPLRRLHPTSTSASFTIPRASYTRTPTTKTGSS